MTISADLTTNHFRALSVRATGRRHDAFARTFSIGWQHIAARDLFVAATLTAES
jgi:hypothetical protein